MLTCTPAKLLFYKSIFHFRNSEFGPICHGCLCTETGFGYQNKVLKVVSLFTCGILHLRCFS